MELKAQSDKILVDGFDFVLKEVRSPDVEVLKKSEGAVKPLKLLVEITLTCNYDPITFVLRKADGTTA